MNALKHIGKQPLKFSFEAYVCDVRGLPHDVSQVSIAWERGGKQQSRQATRAVPTQVDASSEERTAMVDDTLRMPATLYRSTRRATFDAKPSVLRVLDLSGGPYAPPTVLGTADFDLAEQADLNADSPAKSKTLKLPRAIIRRGDGASDAIITLQITIRSRWVQADGASGASNDEMADLPGAPSAASEYPSLHVAPSIASGASSSAASSALTIDALQAFDAETSSAHPLAGAEASRSAKTFNQTFHQRSSSFNRAATRTGGRAESSRIAELSQLVAAAAADARAAESRLAATQFRLKTEVIEAIEGALDSAALLKKPDDVAKAHHATLMHVLDQLGRIANDNDAIAGSTSRGGGVSPLEAEVLSLRRELADSKVEVAMLMGEREELDHVARRLNKQLAEVGARASARVAVR